MKKRDGKCARCGTEVSVGVRACRPCLDKHASKMNERLHRLKAEGLCTICAKEKPEAGKVRCSSCLKKSYQWSKAHAQRKKQAGICTVCGHAPARDGKTLCESCAKKNNARVIARHRRIKWAVFQAYGGARCACCGERNFGFLTLDHINSDGNIHRRELDSIGGVQFYYKVMKAGFPSGLQVLCANCNMGRQWNGGVCPHQQQGRPVDEPQQEEQQSEEKEPEHEAIED